MKRGKKQKIFFAVAVLALLSLPLYFILRSESLLANKEDIYRFKPERMVDPHDPLRGNYLVINFQQMIRIDSTQKFDGDNSIYVIVERDSLGYAHFVRGSREKPSTPNYFTADAEPVTGQSRIAIRVPFNKYFINEENAKLAELVYLKEVRDTATTLFVEVSIRDGESLLKEVYIDSLPLSEYMNKLSPAERKVLEKNEW